MQSESLRCNLKSVEATNAASTNRCGLLKKKKQMKEMQFDKFAFDLFKLAQAK